MLELNAIDGFDICFWSVEVVDETAETLVNGWPVLPNILVMRLE